LVDLEADITKVAEPGLVVCRVCPL